MRKLLIATLLTGALTFALPISNSHAKDKKQSDQDAQAAYEEIIKQYKEKHCEKTKKQKEENTEKHDHNE